MEDDLKKKSKMNQLTKLNLIGCDTIVNSPSLFLLKQITEFTWGTQRLPQVNVASVVFFFQINRNPKLNLTFKIPPTGSLDRKM